MGDHLQTTRLPGINVILQHTHYSTQSINNIQFKVRDQSPQALFITETLKPHRPGRLALLSILSSFLNQFQHKLEGSNIVLLLEFMEAFWLSHETFQTRDYISFKCSTVACQRLPIFFSKQQDPRQFVQQSVHCTNSPEGFLDEWQDFSAEAEVQEVRGMHLSLKIRH